MHQIVDWDFLKSLGRKPAPPWMDPDLDQVNVPYTIIGTLERGLASVLQLGPCEYAVSRTYEFVSNCIPGQYVGAFYWAPVKGNLLYFLGLTDERPRSNTIQPPVQLRPTEAPCTFQILVDYIAADPVPNARITRWVLGGGIWSRNQARDNGEPRFLEFPPRVLRRESSIKRMIALGRLAYCFLEPDDPGEIPFVVSLATNDDDWQIVE